jgi:OTU-like cysteine protease
MNSPSLIGWMGVVAVIVVLSSSMVSPTLGFATEPTPPAQQPLLQPSPPLIQTTAAAATTTTTASSQFQTFEFASNGVCINPPYFVVVVPTTNGKTLPPQQGKQQRNQPPQPPQYFTMRNVPGDGDCMFLAVALAAATSMGLGANDVLLRAISRETRAVVAQVLNSTTSTTLYIEGDRIVSAQSLLQSAARQEGGMSPDDYLRQLQKEGRDGGLYGGGPELTVLSNILRRPISIYELASPQQQQQQPQQLVQLVQQGQSNGNTGGTVTDTTTTATTSSSSSFGRLQCMGVFGHPRFADPCLSIPNSAVLSGVQPGAYSWHLHILVLTMLSGEKHACVLLPHSTPPSTSPPTTNAEPSSSMPTSSTTTTTSTRQ